MKHSGLQIETHQATAPPDNVDAIVLRERITNLREIVDDLRRRAEDVTCTLDWFWAVWATDNVALCYRRIGLLFRGAAF